MLVFAKCKLEFVLQILIRKGGYMKSVYRGKKNLKCDPGSKLKMVFLKTKSARNVEISTIIYFS